MVKKDGSFDKVIAPSLPASFYGFNDVKAGGGSVYGLDTVSSMVYVFDAKGSVVSKFGVSIDPSTSSSGAFVPDKSCRVRRFYIRPLQA